MNALSRDRDEGEVRELVITGRVLVLRPPCERSELRNLLLHLCLLRANALILSTANTQSAMRNHVQLFFASCRARFTFFSTLPVAPCIFSAL